VKQEKKQFIFFLLFIFSISSSYDIVLLRRSVGARGRIISYTTSERRRIKRLQPFIYLDLHRHSS